MVWGQTSAPVEEEEELDEDVVEVEEELDEVEVIAEKTFDEKINELMSVMTDLENATIAERIAACGQVAEMRQQEAERLKLEEEAAN